MEIVKVHKGNIDKFIKFSKSIYVGNAHYRDTMSRTVINILKGKAQICKGNFIEGVMVQDEGRIVAVCVFSVIDRMKDVLQMAYLEMVDDDKAIDTLINYGKTLAKEHGINKLLAGLNIHVNYGLGFLASHFDTDQSLGSAYNPDYYIKLLRTRSTEEITLISYLTSMDTFEFHLEDRLMDRILKEYTVRKADFRNLEKEAKIYTDINNKAFKSHRFYYKRKAEEDLELFREFKLLLKAENLLFLEHKNKPIGFMLWYPDFNQLLSEGESIGLKTLIKSKLFPNTIKKFKIVEIGVIPEYQKTGAVFSLFHECNLLTKGKFDFCESGWVLEDNIASTGLGVRWAQGEYKQYKVFLINV
ncbi:MAG: hypothetical protein KMY55_02365 [Dethiosulfatibacter sp.]|nr:hypothetical protein [Dethiosulfatibacter sp.]